MEPKELRKIVRFCQKNGILRFKSGDFEIELKEKQVYKPSGDIENNPKESFPSWDSLTPEQKLLWSATPDGINPSS